MTCVSLAALTSPALAQRVLAPAPELGPGAAPAEALDVSGEVVEATSYWSAHGDQIYTRAVIRAADGRRFEVRQPGGTVGDIGMRRIPSPPLVATGDRVEARLSRSTTVDATGAAPATKPWIVLEITAHERAGAELPRLAPTGGESGVAGYVRGTTRSGDAPVYWASSCVFITYDSPGTSHIAGDGEFAVMDAAIAHWEQSISSCSYFDVQMEPRAALEVGFDGVNLVKFRDERWCRPSTEMDGGEDCHPLAAAGITTLTFINNPDSDRYGEIVDADIEFNGVRFAISVDGQSEAPAGRCESDLANTFTHEFGHLLGLNHTCLLPGDPSQLNDAGAAVPLCNDTLPDEILEATMHPSQVCGETKKASLEQDDIRGVCEVYPADADAPSCEKVDLGGDKGWCTVSAGAGSSRHTSAPLWLLLAGLGLLLASGRRRRRHAPSRR